MEGEQKKKKREEKSGGTFFFPKSQEIILKKKKIPRDKSFPALTKAKRVECNHQMKKPLSFSVFFFLCYYYLVTKCFAFKLEATPT